MTQFDIEGILEYLPHRYPFILIDRVLEVETSKRAVAIKNVSINEPFFLGHFPGRPVMPGVLILEALAQASAVLAYKTFDEAGEARGLHLFAGIDNARFKQIVRPGDQLRLEVEVLKIKREIWKLHGVASVEGKVVCSADLMSARDVK